MLKLYVDVHSWKHQKYNKNVRIVVIIKILANVNNLSDRWVNLDINHRNAINVRDTFMLVIVFNKINKWVILIDSK